MQSSSAYCDTRDDCSSHATADISTYELVALLVVYVVTRFEERIALGRPLHAVVTQTGYQ